MLKKDRIAIALSSLYILFPLSLIIAACVSSRDALPVNFMGFIFLAFLVIYWGVRFIKGNISFLDKYNDE